VSAISSIFVSRYPSSLVLPIMIEAISFSSGDNPQNPETSASRASQSNDLPCDCGTLHQTHDFPTP